MRCVGGSRGEERVLLKLVGGLTDRKGAADREQKSEARRQKQKQRRGSEKESAAQN
jgi:hypothetical protein